MTTLHDFGGVFGQGPLDTVILGSHNFMVTALDSYVKWPFVLIYFTNNSTVQMTFLTKIKIKVELLYWFIQVRHLQKILQESGCVQ